MENQTENFQSNEIIALLKEIRELLIPISAYYRPQYEETKRQETENVIKEFENQLTPVRETIFPLLFDPKRLSQVEIAEAAKTTQPTVSRFVSQLLERGIIDQVTDKAGNIVFVDKFSLVKILKNKKGGKHE